MGVDDEGDGSLVDLVVQPPIYWFNVLPPKILISSSTRECYPLQGPGIHQILDGLESSIISSQPKKAYGFNKHYQFLNIWSTAFLALHHQVTSMVHPTGTPRNWLAPTQNLLSSPSILIMLLQLKSYQRCPQAQSFHMISISMCI
jgi:hypothetical protein